MSSVWLEGGKINAVPYRSFVVKGKGSVVAVVLFSDDGNLYVAFSKPVAGVAKELLLPSPFVNAGKTKPLRFIVGSRAVTATGYLVVASSKYDLDLFTEEVRFIIEASLGVVLKVRKHKSPDSPPPKRSMLAEEKALYDLAPLDVPSDIVGVEAEAGKEGGEAGEGGGGEGG